ncbi:MAG: chemotaxis protein CheA [Spirochaetia bacterium]
MDMKSNPLDTFREEAAELLESLEQSLISLEEEEDTAEHVGSAFRALHTIKGSGNMFNLTPLVDLAHNVESVFARIRDGKLNINKEIINLALFAKDKLKELASREDPPESLIQEKDALVLEFKKYQDSREKKEESARDKTQEDEETGSLRTYRILFEPSPDLFRNGTNPLALIKELKEMGKILVMGFSEKIPSIREVDPESCYLSWDILLSTEKGENAIRDVFIFVEGESRITVTKVEDAAFDDDDEYDYTRLGEILVQRGDLKRSDLNNAVKSKEFLGEYLVRLGFLSNEKLQSALKEQQFLRKNRETKSTGESSIKVKTEKLDKLVNLVGEFVSMQAHFAMLADQKQDSDFVTMSEQMESLVRDIRDLSMEMHMVPLEQLFTGFRRLVRDVSGGLGKQVKLELRGTETELDKNVIEELKDPLMHIIRNSIDHGIEDPGTRKESGKDPSGTVVLSARYSGAAVVIQVSDDGKGLDAENIKKKAAERGLLKDLDEELPDEKIYDFIFQPGFSTAVKTTNISGRGVGMDVVKRNIEKIHGAVSITSNPGSGTTISLKIPLTLAIIEGLLARIGDGYYMINISYIVECLDFNSLEKKTSQPLVDFRGEIVPYVDLRSHFKIEGEGALNPQLIIVTSESRKVGLLVDGILANYQTVIKSLGKLFSHVQGVSGAVILGDGTLALMLDVDQLCRLTRDELK